MYVIFRCGYYKIIQWKDACDLAILNFVAHDCENATSFYQFQDVRNFKSKIGEKYNSETTESEIDQESTTKKPRRIKKLI